MFKGAPNSSSGSGSTAFSAITSATNTTAAMVVGTGASLATSGSGTIAATSSAAVVVADASGDTTTFPLLAGSATGTLAPLTDAGLTYNATTNALTATTFIGALTGNADTATSASSVSTANEATDTTCFPLFVTASGTQTLQPKNNASLTYNSNTGALGATTFNGLTVTSTTGTFTLTNAKTLSVSNSLTLAGTDSTTMTFPTTSATLARTDAANTFTGTQTIGALVATTINGNTFTTGTGVLTIAASKTLTASNTLTFTGTDSSSVAFGAGGTVAYLGTVQAFSKQQTLTPQALTSSSNSIAWDANSGNNASHTATENTTLANPTNLVTGTVYTFQWTQNASAAKTLAFGNKWKFSGSSTVSVTLSSVQIFTGLYDGTNINTVMTGPFS